MWVHALQHMHFGAHDSDFSALPNPSASCSGVQGWDNPNSALTALGISGLWVLETHQDGAALQVDALYHISFQLHGLGIPTVEAAKPKPDAIDLRDASPLTSYLELL